MTSMSEGRGIPFELSVELFFSNVYQESSTHSSRHSQFINAVSLYFHFEINCY